MVTAIAPADQLNAEPLSTVTLTAGVVGGGAATYTWRLVSGPAVTIVGTGATVTIAAPALVDGATYLIGVTATVAGSTSPEVTCTVVVLPHNEWWWTGTALAPAVESWR